MYPPEEESSTHRSDDPTPEIPADESEFARSLAEVERSLNNLKERYAQIQRDRQRQVELNYRREDVRQNLRRSRIPELKAELRQIEQELATIEFNLESSLFSLDSLKEPFWQAVRFGGLGIILGWLLKSCAL